MRTLRAVFAVALLSAALTALTAARADGQGITITTVFSSVDTRIVDITDLYGGHYSILVPHGFGVAPREVYVVPRDEACYLSRWSVDTVDATNITLDAATTGGTGSWGTDRPQVRLIIKR